MGVRHVLNAAQGTSFIRPVNTSPEYYGKGVVCEFFGVPATDINAYQFFPTATDFIENRPSNPSKGSLGQSLTA